MVVNSFLAGFPDPQASTTGRVYPDCSPQSRYLPYTQSSDAGDNHAVKHQAWKTHLGISVRIVGCFDQSRPEFQMVISDIHLRNRMNNLPLIKKLPDDANREIPRR